MLDARLQDGVAHSGAGVCDDLPAPPSAMPPTANELRAYPLVAVHLNISTAGVALLQPLHWTSINTPVIDTLWMCALPDAS